MPSRGASLRAVAFLACVLVARGTQATERSPDPPHEIPAAVVSIDPYVSIESGADLVTTSVEWLGYGESRLASRIDAPRGLETTGRVLRSFVFDAPVAWWFAVVQHEVFGHGGRAREFGSPAGFHLGSPWGGRDSYATFEADGLSTDELLRVFTGGSEANGRTATILERELVGGRAMTPITLLFLAANRSVVSDYVLRTTPDPVDEPTRFFREWRGGGDVANYLGTLSRRFEGDPGITPEATSPLVRREYRRLRRDAIWNVADPGLWLALWSACRWAAVGESPRVPLPRSGGRTLLPILSADWLPDGGVRSLELVWTPAQGDRLFRDARWVSAVARYGSGPGGGFGAIGFAAERFATIGRGRLGGDVEVWTRLGRGVGGGLRARVDWNAAGTGWFVEAGVKSAGHWPGRPAGTGPMIRVGVGTPR